MDGLWADDGGIPWGRMNGQNDGWMLGWLASGLSVDWVVAWMVGHLGNCVDRMKDDSGCKARMHGGWNALGWNDVDGLHRCDCHSCMEFVTLQLTGRSFGFG